MPDFFPFALFSLSVLKISSSAYLTSGTRIISAPTVNPTVNARKPLLRPITSTTKTLSWEIAVSRILSISLTAVFTAVSKPIVSSVPKTSLSIVAGTPTISVSVSLLNSKAPLKEPLPPMTMRPSTLFEASVSAAFLIPSLFLNCGDLDVLRIVPPNCNIPPTERGVKTVDMFVIKPSHPLLKPKA